MLSGNPHTGTAQRPVRPGYLLLVHGPLPPRSPAFGALLGWVATLRGSVDLTLAADPHEPEGYAELRRVCARMGIPASALPDGADPCGGAAMAGRPWDCVEITCSDIAAAASRPPPVCEATLRVLTWHPDGPPPAAGPATFAPFLAAMDLVICPARAGLDWLGLAPPRAVVAVDAPARQAAVLAAIEARHARAGPAVQPRRILQVTPAHFAAGSVTGGAGRYVENLRRAVHGVAGDTITCPVLSCGPPAYGADGVTVLPGDVSRPESFDQAALDGALAAAGAVHVHQCLTRFGLFAAARARLLGRPVIGTDHGGGQAPFLNAQPHLMGLFDVIQTYSAFGDLSAYNLPVPRERILGPVDETLFGLAGDADRDPALVVSVGRLLPHKGFEAVIDALPATLRLVIAGTVADPDYAAFLRTRAKGRNVHFEHTLNDAALIALLQGAGLCVQASTHRDYLGRTIAKPELLGLAPLEALCTGCPAIVSDAGALGELGALPGCFVARTPDGLAALLRQYAEGDLPIVPGAAIRDQAVATYGLQQFGVRYAAMTERLRPCAC